MVFDPYNSVWTEKYRPKKIGDIVGDFKEKISEYLKKPQEIPNFLLYSKTPGTGKTTLAKAIIAELGCDALVLNSSDDRKIDVVREKVKEFSITKSSKNNIKRCVFMDEFDGMLKASQDALRNVMETFAGNVFFILTANNINKVTDAIRSRCVMIPFAYPSREEILKYLENICVKEGMDYSDDGLKTLLDKNYPSIRNCVLALQDLKIESKAVLPENIKRINQLLGDMWLRIKEKKWNEIRKIVMESTIDPRELNTYFWEQALDEENIKVLQICCRNEKDIAWGADAKIIFITSLIEMIR